MRHGGVRTALGTVAALLVLSACGADEPGAARGEPSAGASGTAPGASAGASSGGEPLPCVPAAEPFTGEAAQVFGADEVMAAYCLLAEQAAGQAGTSLALLVGERRTADLARLLDPLTAPARRRAERWLAADPTDPRVTGLTLHDVRRAPAGYRRADDGPFVFGTVVSAGRAEPVRGGEALALTFEVSTGVVLEQVGDPSGRHSVLPVTRRATFVLVPTGRQRTGGWSVVDWDAAFEHGRVRLV